MKETNHQTTLTDVPAFHVVAGNPARIIKKIEPKEPDPRLSAPGDEIIIGAAEQV